MQVSSEIAAGKTLYFPLEHNVHEAVPLTSLYVPVMHALHAYPSGPVYPLLHVQLVSCRLPRPEKAPAGH